MNRELAPAARFERDLRARHYPAAVAAGRMSAEDAEAEYQAWCAIAGWLEARRLPDWAILHGIGSTADRPATDPRSSATWAALDRAATAAERLQEEALAKDRSNVELRHRRDDVAAIRKAVADQRRFLTLLNDALHAGAARQAA